MKELSPRQQSRLDELRVHWRTLAQLESLTEEERREKAELAKQIERLERSGRS